METQTIIVSPTPAVHPLKCFASWNNFQGEVGDLVEIDRTLFSHWAVYIGDGKVIHVCGQNKTSSTCTEAHIVEDTLCNVAGNSLVRVNNKEVPALQRNLIALHPKMVIENAKKCLHQKFSHNVMSVTAEQFVTSCKYGSGWSDQANTIASVLKKRTKPARNRNKSGNAKKDPVHGMVLRKTADRRDSLQKTFPFATTTTTTTSENPPAPKRMGEALTHSNNNTLAPLVKGLADIFKRKVPGSSKFTPS